MLYAEDKKTQESLNLTRRAGSWKLVKNEAKWWMFFKKIIGVVLSLRNNDQSLPVHQFLQLEKTYVFSDSFSNKNFWEGYSFLYNSVHDKTVYSLQNITLLVHRYILSVYQKCNILYMVYYSVDNKLGISS